MNHYQTKVPRYDARRLAQRLAKKGSLRPRPGRPAQFDWKGFGVRVGVCFKAVPSNVSFLNGPIEANYTPKQRKKPDRKKRRWLDDEEEDHPDGIDQRRAHAGDDKLSAVGENIKELRRSLQKRARDQLAAVAAQQNDCQKRRKLAREASRVDAPRFLFDPDSFARTVENLYNFSFEVLKGTAGIGLRREEDAQECRRAGVGGDILAPGPVVYPVKKKRGGVGPSQSKRADCEEDRVTDGGARKQAVLTFNMKQWKKMCEVFVVGEDDADARKRRTFRDLGQTANGVFVEDDMSNELQSSFFCQSTSRCVRDARDKHYARQERTAKDFGLEAPPLVVTQTDNDSVGADLQLSFFYSGDDMDYDDLARFKARRSTNENRAGKKRRTCGDFELATSPPDEFMRGHQCATAAATAAGTAAATAAATAAVVTPDRMSPAALAAAMMPDRVTPSPPPRTGLLQTQQELALHSYKGGNEEENTKMGVDNPQVRNPYYSYGDMEQTEKQMMPEPSTQMMSEPSTQTTSEPPSIDNKDVRDEMIKTFSYFDSDGSGKISFEKLKRVANTLGENVSDDLLEEMINEADRSGTGEVCQEDFIRIMCAM
ncbi:hypothetical protein ACHAWF_017738 [Thalassiosira exigua]